MSNLDPNRRSSDSRSGVAEGAGRSVNEIVALNVRTEINFGLITDGCTALAHCADGSSFLAQNWDWMPKQKENLIQLTILQAGKPTIKMITEAGIIGKIGLNSEGVGVCLNAIRAKGVDKNRLPCHLALRLVLECSSAAEAEKALKSVGVASACHMLIADEHGSVGVECSSIDLQFLRMNHSGQIFHTNHFLAEHKGVHDTVWLKDSPVRLARLEHLCGMLAGEVSLPQIASIFRDTEGLPVSICRDDESQTLFSIAMDLCRRTAYVVMGKPTEREEELVLSF